MIKNLKLKYKIFDLAAIMMVFMAIISLTTIKQLNQISKEIDGIAKEDLPLTKIITEISSHQLEQAALFKNPLRLGEQLNHLMSHHKDPNYPSLGINRFCQGYLRS